MPGGSEATEAALEALLVRVAAAAPVAALKAALIVQRFGMLHSPVKSGTLRRSWRTQVMLASPGVAGTHVGPSVVYARRLELGFQGSDALGRQYHQPPRPYVRPALVEAMAPMRAAVVDTYVKAIRG